MIIIRKQGPLNFNIFLLLTTSEQTLFTSVSSSAKTDSRINHGAISSISPINTLQSGQSLYINVFFSSRSVYLRINQRIILDQLNYLNIFINV